MIPQALARALLKPARQGRPLSPISKWTDFYYTSRELAIYVMTVVGLSQTSKRHARRCACLRSFFCESEFGAAGLETHSQVRQIRDPNPFGPLREERADWLRFAKTYKNAWLLCVFRMYIYIYI